MNELQARQAGLELRGQMRNVARHQLISAGHWPAVSSARYASRISTNSLSTANVSLSPGPSDGPRGTTGRVGFRRVVRG